MSVSIDDANAYLTGFKLKTSFKCKPDSDRADELTNGMYGFIALTKI
jgi:hypothetical protein